MFEKIGNAAETLATNVSLSRRGFLGRLGQAAVGAAGVMAGLLLLPGNSQASPPCPDNVCTYTCPDGSSQQLNCVAKCKKHYNGCTLTRAVVNALCCIS